MSEFRAVLRTFVFALLILGTAFAGLTDAGTVNAGDHGILVHTELEASGGEDGPDLDVRDTVVNFGISVAASTSSAPGFGSSEASAILDGAGFAFPTLRTSAIPAGIAVSEAFALGFNTYRAPSIPLGEDDEGTVMIDFAVDFQLTGTTSGDGILVAQAGAYASGIFPSEFEDRLDNADPFRAMRDMIGDVPSFDDDLELVIQNGGSGPATGTLFFSVFPERTFTLAASLSAQATGTSSADGFNTFVVTGFTMTGPDGLLPVSSLVPTGFAPDLVPIPEPGTWVLLVGAGVVLAVRRRSIRDGAN